GGAARAAGWTGPQGVRVGGRRGKGRGSSGGGSSVTGSDRRGSAAGFHGGGSHGDGWRAPDRDPPPGRSPRPRRTHFVMTNRSTSSPSVVTWRTVKVRPSTSATVSECTLEMCLYVNSCQEAGSSCCSGLYRGFPPPPVTTYI